jgi:hypothetical protein
MDCFESESAIEAIFVGLSCFLAMWCPALPWNSGNKKDITICGLFALGQNQEPK